MARIDRTKRAAFDALARRDAARGTRRNESLLRGRLFRLTPAWRVNGIVGYRPRMSIIEIATRHGGRRPLTMGARVR